MSYHSEKGAHAPAEGLCVALLVRVPLLQLLQPLFTLVRRMRERVPLPEGGQHVALLIDARQHLGGQHHAPAPAPAPRNLGVQSQTRCGPQPREVATSFRLN